MKKETEQIYNLEWVLLIALTAFIMSISASCQTIKKNIDSNYRAKNGLEPLEKKEVKKTQVARF